MYSDPYYSRPELSFHKLMDFKRSPGYFYRKHIMKVIQDGGSDAMAFGRAAHCLLLEGADAYARRFVLVPPEHLTPSGTLSTKKETREWVSQQTDRDIICPEQHQLLLRLQGRLAEHREAACVLESGLPEVERFETVAEVACKGKADWYCEARGLIVDLKTTRDLDDFQRQAFDFHYDRQLAFYRRLFGARHAALIVVETTEPYRIAVASFSEPDLARADSLNMAILEQYRVCELSGIWPIDPSSPLVLRRPETITAA